MLAKPREKLVKILLAVYLLLSAGTAVCYFWIGQWKAIVRWCGIVDALLVLIGLILFVLYCCRRDVKTPLWVVHILLTIMQVFPMFGGFMLGGYTWNGIVSLLLLAIGILTILLQNANEKTEEQ